MTTTAARLLKEVFGFPGFRPGQEEIVSTVLAGEDVMAVLPTGAGKSLCYQLPALVLGGLTVVVSPLIALMRDQVSALREYGVGAGSLTSANDESEKRRVQDEMRAGTLRLLYAAPERLLQPGTLDWLSRQNVRLLAIDEAHCVSQWGHDFRPEYAALGEVKRRLGVPAIALTATADKATRADILAQLFEAEPRIFVHGFDRPNLRLAIQPKDNARQQLLRLLDRQRGQSGVIYCPSRRETERLAEAITTAGYRALPYHAGMAAPERDRNQDTFLREDGVVMVATIAFGMGIDKPDVRFVAHAGLPKSIEAYYQEIGRAGRDGLPADTLTLWGFDDLRLRRLQIEEAQSSDEQKRIDRQRLNALIALCEAPTCRRQTLLAYFGEDSGPCGNCDLCQEGVAGFDGTVAAQMLLSAIYRTGERFGAEHIVSVLLGEETDTVKRLGHDGLKTFGVGKARSKDEWRSLLRQIYAAQLVTLDVSGPGGFAIAERGWSILRGQDTIQLRTYVPRPKEKGRRRASTTGTMDQPHDSALLVRLKALRTELAREHGVPAYVIFPDRSLIDMAARQPRTLDEMALVHGVGQAKLDRYGNVFLAAIAAA